MVERNTVMIFTLHALHDVADQWNILIHLNRVACSAPEQEYSEYSGDYHFIVGLENKIPHGSGVVSLKQFQCERLLGNLLVLMLQSRIPQGGNI